MTSPFAALIEQATLDAPWSLVEAFSTMPRWKPADVEVAAHDIARRLGDLGVPVTLHEANLYLSIPYTASVNAGGVTSTRSRPPMRAIAARA